MKLKIIFFGCALILALSTTFASKQKKLRGPIDANWIYADAGGPPQCKSLTFALETNEATCADFYTGPVCTVTPSGLSTRTAYSPFTFSGMDCITPLRQP